MVQLKKSEVIALGWFAVHVINNEFKFEFPIGPEDPLDYCCVKHCAPCARLHWFYNNDREVLESIIRLTGYQENGWAFWDEENDALRWDLLMENWKRHQGCSMSKGIIDPCGLYYKGED